MFEDRIREVPQDFPWTGGALSPGGILPVDLSLVLVLSLYVSCFVVHIFSMARKDWCGSAQSTAMRLPGGASVAAT